MWAQEVVSRTVAAYTPLADPERGAQEQRYMKDVAPFLGLVTAERRKAQRAAWRGMDEPPEPDLWAAVTALWQRPEREYHYAAIELVARFRVIVAPERLDHEIRDLVVTKSWWDTVDLASSTVINPLVTAHPNLVAVMWQWNRSGDQWLVRASIQHQRGRGNTTDVPLVIAMCAPHADDRRFFVAKAIGWALRDLARVEPGAVRAFLAAHPRLPAVARREADRGLARLDAT